MKNMSSIREQMAQRIVALRTARGLSASELARQTRQARQTVHNWEAAKAKPDDEAMLAVAKVLGTSVSYLYGETNDPRPVSEWGSAYYSEAAITYVASLLDQARSRLADIAPIPPPVYSPLPDMTEAEALDVFATDLNGMPYEGVSRKGNAEAARREKGE